MHDRRDVHADECGQLGVSGSREPEPGEFVLQGAGCTGSLHMFRKLSRSGNSRYRCRDKHGSRCRGRRVQDAGLP